jgi:hypothetical protein
MDVERDGQRGKLRLAPGECLHIVPGMKHRMTAIEDCDVLEVSTPELDDVVRLEHFPHDFFFWLILKFLLLVRGGWAATRLSELRPPLALILFFIGVTLSLLPDFHQAGDYRYFFFGAALKRKEVVIILVVAGLALCFARRVEGANRVLQLGMAAAWIAFIVAGLADAPLYHHDVRILFFTLLALIYLHARDHSFLRGSAEGRHISS